MGRRKICNNTKRDKKAIKDHKQDNKTDSDESVCDQTNRNQTEKENQKNIDLTKYETERNKTIIKQKIQYKNRHDDDSIDTDNEYSENTFYNYTYSEESNSDQTKLSKQEEDNIKFVEENWRGKNNVKPKKKSTRNNINIKPRSK